jgi:hypothetical protein
MRAMRPLAAASPRQPYVLDTDKQCDTVSTSGLRRLRQALHWRGSVRAAEIPVMCTHPACVGDPPAHVGELGPSSFGGQIPVQAELPFAHSYVFTVHDVSPWLTADGFDV